MAAIPSKLACITGASSGIGEAYARLLASQGYNLLLVARRQDRLLKLADELSTASGTCASVLPLDLTIPENLECLADRLLAEDSLRVLVNSAGYGTAAWFSTADLPDQVGMLGLHIRAPVVLSHAALQPMLRAGEGAIVNISSLVAFFQVPTVAVYAASKRFMVDFSQSMAMEVRKKGVHVQALCPGLVATDLHERLAFNTRVIPAFAWLPAEKVVSASWRAVRKRSGLCIPGFLNQAAYALTRFIPTRVVRGLLLAFEPVLLQFLNEGNRG